MSVILQRRAELVDPHDCTDAADELSILGAICEPLVRRTGDGFVPALADGWQPDGEAREWRITLAPGRRFSDGSPVDAAAVAATLTRMARPDIGATLGAPAVWRGYLGGAGITVEDERALRIRLQAPMADLTDILAQTFVPAPACLPALDAGDKAALIGSGPFRLAGVAEGEVRLSGPRDLIVRIEPDAARRAMRLFSGEAVAATNLPWDSRFPDGFTRVETLVPVAIIYLMNAARGPLADVRIRRALDLALDRDALVAGVMGGGARRLDAIVSPLHFGAPGPATDGPDHAAARALLAEAGAEGLTLEVSCPTRLPDEAQRLTAALAAQLAEVGVTLRVTLTEDRTAYANAVREKRIGDLAVFDSSPLSTFRVLHEKIDSRVAGPWWEGYRNPQVEALIDTARKTPDSIGRAAIYGRVIAMLQADPPWLSLYNPMRVTGLAGRHHGFALPLDAVPDLAALPC